MSGWESSDRASRLPSDWTKRAKAVKDRDGWRCTQKLPSGARCPRTKGLQVDHRRAGDDHSMSNLQTLCEEHHRKKTEKESQRGRWLPPTKKRREPHPGDRRS